ncbi:IPT/TIG domain-containing protein, partial [Cellulomonas terrae]|uniref:IPT/TIG domain-containing protein n=1 Tax=Cellulomonas terrae TaxID=311234 RepID=UPI0011BD7C7A
VPAHAAGTARLVVTTTSGGPSAAASLSYAAARTPTVSAVWPAVLATDGGVRVTVTGAGFSDATAVTFGGTPGTGLQVVSSTRLTVVAPARSAGAALVRVTSPAGTSTTSPSFLYVDVADGFVSQTPQRAEFRRDVAPNVPVCLQITGTNGVPVGASGVVLNVTTVAPGAPGHVIVYPDTDGNGATPAPVGSTVNFEPGADVANAAFVQLPENGKVCYLTRSGGTVGVVLDVTGFMMPDAGIVTQASQRLVDTRSAYRVGTVAGPVPPRTVQTVQVRGVAGVPENASAVILSAVVTNVNAPGNLRIFPAGQDVPVSSVVNYAPGKDKATATVVGLPASGKISFYSDTFAPVHTSPVEVILDVTGYVVGDAVYSAVPPQRVIDTRPGSGHLGPIPGALAAGTAYQVRLPGSAGIPTGATAVVLNVVAISPSSVGNLRFYP